MTQSTPTVLDVGNCDPDHAAICAMLEPSRATVDRVMFVEQALHALREKTYDLVLVNRLIFADGSDALPLIERMKADEKLRSVPVMMISNYDDAQDRAEAAGAVRAFGKSALRNQATADLLEQYLTPEKKLQS